MCNTRVMLVLKCVSVSMGSACSLQCVWGVLALFSVYGECLLSSVCMKCLLSSVCMECLLSSVCMGSACSLQCVWSACSLQCVWSACFLQCVWGVLALFSVYGVLALFSVYGVLALFSVYGECLLSSVCMGSACSLQFGIVHIGLAGHTSIEPLQLATQLQTEIRLNNSLGWSLTPSLQKASNGRSIGTATRCQGRSQCYGAHHLEFVPPGSDSNFSTRGQKSRWDTPSPSSDDPKMSSQQQHSVLEEVEEEEEEKGEEANRIMQGKEVFKKFKKKKGKNNRYTGLALRLGLVCGLR